MATSDVTALQRTGLNDFLFADVGTEANGMTLSVVSIFARQGSDPWREAGRLAALPKAEAADSLARTIASMPQSLWSLAEAALIATRLIDLLPARSAGRATRTAGFPTGWRLSARTAIVLFCLMLGAGYAVSMMLQHDPARPDGGDVGSFTTLPPAPPR